MRTSLLALAALTLLQPALAQEAYQLNKLQADSATVVTANEKRLASLPANTFTPGNFQASNGVALVYQLHKPNAKEKLPLVVIMHGSGGIGTDNKSQISAHARSWVDADMQRNFPAYVLLPQVPARTADYFPSKLDSELMSVARPPLQAVLELVQKTIGQHAIDPKRVYIIGFSMGASGTWHALVQQPNLFAAGVAFSGIAPERNLASTIAKTPLLIVHGNSDTQNPIGADKKMFSALQTLHAPVRLIEIEGLEHTIAPEMIFASDWRTWLFAQRRTH